MTSPVALRGVGRRPRLSQRARTLALASVLAVLSALVIRSYLAGYADEVAASYDEVRVVVAAADIEPGAAVDQLFDDGVLVWRDVVRRDLVDDAVTSAEALDGKVAADRVYAGEQLTARRLVSPSQLGVQGALTGPLRAVALAGDPQRLLSGILHDGDHVDVLVTRQASAMGATAVECRLLRDVTVLRAPDTEGEAGGLGAGASATVVLALTDLEAQTVLVAGDGAWTLLLRPNGDVEQSPRGQCPSGGW